MTMAPHATVDARGSQFRTPAREVLERVRDAMKSLIEALPEPIHRAVDLQSSLGIYRSLAWRAFKIATASEPLDAAEYMLTPALVHTLVTAAEKKGIPHEITFKVQAAMDMYTRLMREHAGDTDSLMMMLESVRPKKKTLLDEALRKGAFQHNRLIWGYQQEVTSICLIVSFDGNQADYSTIVIVGTIGFHQIRPMNGDLTFYHQLAPPEDKTALEIGCEHSLLTDYSSLGLNLEFNRRDSIQSDSIVSSPDLGRKSAISFFQMMTSNQQQPQSERIGLKTAVSVITKMLHLDIAILGANQVFPVSARVYGRNARVGIAKKCLDDDVLPIELSPAYLGSVTDMPPARGVARYPEMIRSVLRRFDYYGRNFDVYRCRMPYPILKSVVKFEVNTVGVENSDSEIER